MIRKPVEYAHQPKTEAEFAEIAFEQLKRVFPSVEKESQLKTKNGTSIVVDILARSANGQLILFEVKFVPPGRTLAYSEYLSLAALKDAVADISPEASPIVVLLVAGHVDEPVRMMFARAAIPVVALAPTYTETRDRLRDACQQLVIYLPEFTPVLKGCFIVALYKATERIWEMGFDAAWAPVGLALKERFTRWAGRDKESQRRAAFIKAADRARCLMMEQARDWETTQAILEALDAGRNRDAAEALAEEGAKLMLFSAHPDVPRLTRLCAETLRWESFWEKEKPPPPEAVAAVLSDFLANLREALLDQEPYHDLIQRETLRALREIVAELRPVAYDDEATYRAQVAEMYRQLEFVGIPELKERRPITVEDIFIRLRAKRQIEVIPDWELEEQVEDAVVRRDAQQLTALSARQRARARMGLIGRRVTPEERQQWLEELEAAAEARDARTVVTLQRRLERTAPLVTEVSVEESLKQADRMVILGDPGAGKTTLLKYLTVICAEGRAQKELSLTVGSDGHSPLPIFVPLREFAAECTQREEDYSLLDHLHTCARERLLLNLPPGFFEEALDDGRCLVCLDGLDEVWAVGQRKSVRDAVKALAARFPRSRYLVTSRIVGYVEAPLDRRDFVHHTILPFENEDIRQFVRQWYEARERDPVQRKQKADNLIATIEREPRIRSLAQNPLLLTIIALVHRIEAELPYERVKLYDKCVTALVETWEEVKGLSLEEKERPFYRYRRRLLEQLAYELHTRAEEPGQLQTVKEGDLELLLCRFLMENPRLGFADDPDGARDEVRAFIHLARGRTGLLVERGEGVFGFPHLTFQEYLAACDIENRCIHRGVEAIWEEIEPRLHDPHWREVVLLLLGSLNKYDEPPTLLVERILEAGKDDKFEPVLHRHLYLVAGVLADRVDVADDLHREIVNELLTVVRQGFWTLEFYPSTGRVYIEGESSDALFHALSNLKEDTYAAEGLIELAQDTKVDTPLRSAAAWALGKLGWKEEAVEIILGLVRDKKVAAFVRSDAGWALGQLGCTEEAAEILSGLVRDEEVDAEVRVLAASTLGELGRIEEAVEILLGLARGEKVDPWVRNDAAFVLRHLGRAEEAGETLLALAQGEKVISELRDAAARALVQLAHDEEAAGLLLALARAPHVDAPSRRDAANVLGQLGRREEAADILRKLAWEPGVEDRVRPSIARALGEVSQITDAADMLKVMAQNKDLGADARVLAAEFLKELGWGEEASELLQQMNERETLAFLRQAQSEKLSDSMRLGAIFALRDLGPLPETIISGVVALARDPEAPYLVRSIAARTVGLLGRSEEAAEILLTLAQDPQVETGERYIVAIILEELDRVEEAGEILLKLARDEEVETWRRFAASALGRLGRAEEKVLDGLLALACDEKVNARMRGTAYQSLKALVGVATD